MNVRGEMNSQDDMGADSDDTGYRASFSYIDQFLDNTLGVTFGFAHLESPLAIEGAGTYEPWHRTIRQWTSSTITPKCRRRLRHEWHEDPRRHGREPPRWRDGCDSVAAERSYETMLDLYYTKRKQTDNARSLEVNLGNYPIACEALRQSPVSIP